MVSPPRPRPAPALALSDAGSASSSSGSWDLVRELSGPPLRALGELYEPVSPTVAASPWRTRTARRPAWVRRFIIQCSEWAAVLFLIFVSEVLDSARVLSGYPSWSPAASPADPPGPANATMPAAWERRYLRQSESAGLEVLVVSRGTAATWWAVVLPDQSVAEFTTSDRANVKVSPQNGILYTPMPVISEERKGEITRLVEEKKARRSLRRLSGLLSLGVSSELQRLLFVAAAVPATFGR